MKSDFIVAGIDYSINSPAIVISNIQDDWDHCRCKAFYFDNRKCAPVNPQSDFELHSIGYPVWTTPEDRYERLSLWAASILVSEHVDLVYLEGYALSRSSSNGLVFNIAENGGVLKHHLHIFGVKFKEISPTELKSWVTGNGRAQKEDMEKCFVSETNISNMRNVLDLTLKATSPIGDIIDAYYLCKYGYMDNTIGIIKPEKKPKPKKKKIKGMAPLLPFEPTKNIQKRK